MPGNRSKNPKNCYAVGNSWMCEFVFKGERYRENLGPVSRSVAKDKAASKKTKAAEGKLEVNGRLWNGDRWIVQEPEEEAIDPVFGEALDHYLATAREGLKPRSYTRLGTSAVALRPFFDGKRLSQIKAFDIERYKVERRKVCSCGAPRRWRMETGGRCPTCGHYYRQRAVATVNRELALLKALFRKAVEWGWLTQSPMPRKGVLYKEPKGRTRFLTPEEAAGLLSACGPELRQVVLAALHTGCRAGELRTLRWSAVDLSRRTITIESAYSKNGETRSVPLTEELASVLSEMRQQRKAKPEDPVFVRRYGQPWQSWHRAFTSATKRANIFDFKFHDLRHTFASWLAMAGVVETARADLMGHDPAMQARYAHIDVDYKQAAVAKLPALGEIGTESPQNSPSAGTAEVVTIAK